MKRLATKQLKDWYNLNVRAPLLIKGARQVGKSTLVHIFCEQENLNLVELNLEEQKIAEFEKETSFNPLSAKREIEAITAKKIDKNTVLFIDEIQEQPRTYGRLRYFYENEKTKNIPVITAGSLLEFRLEREKIKKTPVGRIEHLYLGPMSFIEFLIACDKDILIEQMNDVAEQGIPLNQTAFDQLVSALKEYYFVGGMPKAVKSFIGDGGFSGFFPQLV